MIINKQKWMVQNKSADFEGLGKALNLDPVTVRLLRNRGLTTLDEMKQFLDVKPEQMEDPMLLKDMKKGVAVMKHAIEEGESIRVIGDYDADGITSSYILYRTLNSVGGKVSVAIPHRVKDGYGLNVNLINQCKEDGITTIITCDNGVSAKEALEVAREYGIRVVVTDHHRIPEEEITPGKFVPIKVKADAVINPKQEDCCYPFKDLCGAGVAYKFACALLEEMTGEERANITELKKELLIYAAIGTVGDVMDLLGENRIIVKCGLNYIKDSQDPSLCALLDACGLNKQHIKAGNVGFQIAPCLNASGRIDSAQHAIDLLICKDIEVCKQQAERLVAMNEERKRLTETYVQEAIKQAQETDDKVLVLYLPECHESIAGIVAGRIREQFLKPTLVITRAEEMCKGSGRSIPAYAMYDEMTRAKDLFAKFGGHSMAVGFSLEEGNIPLLREKLNLNCTLLDDDLQEKVSIDVPMPIDYVTMDLLNEFQRLEPFGKANPTPLFAQRDVELKYINIVGRERKFVRLIMETPNGKGFEGVYFIRPEEFQEFLADKFDEETAVSYMSGRRGTSKISVCYQPEINTYMDKKSIRYQIRYVS